MGPADCGSGFRSGFPSPQTGSAHCPAPCAVASPACRPKTTATVEKHPKRTQAAILQFIVLIVAALAPIRQALTDRPQPLS